MQIVNKKISHYSTPNAIFLSFLVSLFVKINRKNAY